MFLHIDLICHDRNMVCVSEYSSVEITKSLWELYVSLADRAIFTGINFVIHSEDMLLRRHNCTKRNIIYFGT